MIAHVSVLIFYFILSYYFDGGMEYMLKFAEEWLSELDHEDLRSLLMFLVIMLMKHFNFTQTNADSTLIKQQKRVREMFGGGRALWSSIKESSPLAGKEDTDGVECYGRMKT